MTIPPDAPHDYVSLVRLERQRLLELLGELDPSDWPRQTPCPGWTVLDLVNHLVGGDMSIVSRNRDRHDGTPAPPGLPENSFVAWLDELQNDWVTAARRISPQLAIGLLRWLDRPVVDALEAQAQRSRHSHVSWAADGPVPVWLDHGRELAERWIHRQQLLEAVTVPSDLRRDLAVPVLDVLRWCYPHRLTTSDIPGDSVTIEITGSVPFRWSLVRSESSWRFADVDLQAPDARLTMSTEQAWRLMTNNYRTSAHGKIDCYGNDELVDVLPYARAIIGAPKLA